MADPSDPRDCATDPVAPLGDGCAWRFRPAVSSGQRSAHLASRLDEDVRGLRAMESSPMAARPSLRRQTRRCVQALGDVIHSLSTANPHIPCAANPTRLQP
jgi:hypothetical protein